jgi:Helix-turn-helix domain
VKVSPRLRLSQFADVRARVGNGADNPADHHSSKTQTDDAVEAAMEMHARGPDLIPVLQNARQREPSGPVGPTRPGCDRLWSVTDVSRFLGVPISTLHQWRYLGRGPAAFRVGKHLRYDPDAVRRWLVDECADEPA